MLDHFVGLALKTLAPDSDFLKSLLPNTRVRQGRLFNILENARDTHMKYTFVYSPIKQLIKYKPQHAIIAR